MDKRRRAPLLVGRQQRRSTVPKVVATSTTTTKSNGFQLEVLRPRRERTLPTIPPNISPRKAWGAPNPPSQCRDRRDENKRGTMVKSGSFVKERSENELENIPDGGLFVEEEKLPDFEECDERDEEKLSPFGLSLKDLCMELEANPYGELSEPLLQRVRRLFRLVRTHTEWTTAEAEMAESILRRTVETNCYEMNRLNFISVINAYAKSSCAEAARRMLSYMEDVSKKGRRDLHPNRMAINTVIRAYALSFEEGAANKAVYFLRRLEEDYANGDESRKPSARSYGKVVDALAKHEEVERARDLLYEIQEQSKTEDSDWDLDCACYTPVIIAFLKRQRVQEAHDVLCNLLDLYRHTRRDLPDGHVFFHVIAAWIKAKEYNCRQDRLIYLVDAMQEFGFPCGYRTNAVLIPALVASGRERHVDKAEMLLRDAIQSQTVACGICYRVMDVIASQGKKDAAKRCEDILDLMETHNVFPDVRCFNAAMKAHRTSDHSDRTEKAMFLFERLDVLGVEPTSATYVFALQCCRKADPSIVKLYNNCMSRGLLEGDLKRKFGRLNIRPPWVCSMW